MVTLTRLRTITVLLMIFSDPAHQGMLFCAGHASVSPSGGVKTCDMSVTGASCAPAGAPVQCESAMHLRKESVVRLLYSFSVVSSPAV